MNFFNIIVKCRNQNYHVARIGVNLLKQELFYHFIYLKNIKLFGKKPITNLYGTDKIDHISFHQDGKIHLKYKNNNREIIKEYPENIFNFEQSKVYSLLMHSLYFDHKIVQFPLFRNIAGHNIYFPLTNTQNFSILVFITYKSINVENFLQSNNFDTKLDMFSFGESIGFQDFPKFRLIIGFSKKILPIQNEIILPGKVNLFTYELFPDLNNLF